MSVHRETFAAFVKKQGWVAGAELGVDKGILFGMLLRECPELQLLGVDLFPDRVRSRRAFELADEHHLRCGLMAMSTSDASAHVPDGHLDFVFIDADHGEKAVAEDIKHWQPKVRAGGWLGGHDYNRKFPGVIKAVDAAFGARVHEMPGSIWGVWL